MWLYSSCGNKVLPSVNTLHQPSPPTIPKQVSKWPSPPKKKYPPTRNSQPYLRNQWNGMTIRPPTNTHVGCGGSVQISFHLRWRRQGAEFNSSNWVSKCCTRACKTFTFSWHFLFRVQDAKSLTGTVTVLQIVMMFGKQQGHNGPRDIFFKKWASDNFGAISTW